MAFRPIAAAATALAAGLALGLTACAAGPGSGPGGAGPTTARERERERERLLPPTGDPGRVAATDIAFARAARDEGQWTAFRRFAAAGAQMHGPDGLFDAESWLARQADPAQAVRWEPRAVWSSCDGSIAVSLGRSEQPDGVIGTYVTVWQLQDDRDYKWVYDMGGADDPQPAPRRPDEPLDPDAIVVTGLDAIEGKVADCPRGQPVPPPPAAAIPADATHGQSRSKDGTLQWRWEHRPGGNRRVVVDYLRDGTWQQALDFTRTGGA